VPDTQDTTVPATNGQPAAEEELMESIDFYSAERSMQMHVASERNRARVRGLAREARPFHRPWLTRQACGLLCQLGYSLVALGARLEEHARQPFAPAVVGGRRASTT
jgi:hypothetical protein